jgi:hypothetical protein
LEAKRSESVFGFQNPKTKKAPRLEYAYKPKNKNKKPKQTPRLENAYISERR